MARSIFRVAEYLMGNNGYLLRHEYFLYIFDAVLMFLVMVLFLVYRPSQVNVDIVQPSDTEMAEGGKHRSEKRRHLKIPSRST